MIHYASISLASWLFVLLIVIYAATIISCIVVVLSENRNPIRSLAWVLALIFLPVVGLIFYMFFGRSLRNLHMISRHNKRRLLERNKRVNVDLNKVCLPEESRQIIKLAYALARTPYTQNNQITVFTRGADKFDALKHDILAASKYIYLQYYIFLDDELGREIASLLIKKAAQGVDVKVIYDHVGSFSAKNRFFKQMRDNGVDVHPFFRVSFPQLANRINWRNHRKIVVIDGAVGYLGGMNIANRYIDEPPDNRSWRDTHFRVTGDIVTQLLYSFAVDWNFMGNPIPANIFKIHKPSDPNNVGMQLVTSGPNDPHDNLTLCYLKAIGSAKKRIYIQTPYFLPTDALLHALEAASMSQIDVRIMIPRVSDSRLLQLASFSYVTQCLRTGIKVYLYEPGMLHAKAMIIDDNISCVGSTNFDFRSFENNFEDSLFVYDNDFNILQRDIFFSDIESCTKLTYAGWHKRPRRQRLLESIVRLMSPVL